MEYNDFELIYMAKEKNEEAINFLYKKYKPLLEKKARDYHSVAINKGIEYNDFLQEAMIGFEEAISNYNPSSNTLFYTFVNLCVDRQLKSVLTKINRNKNKIISEAVSLDYMYDGETSVADFIKEEKSNPEELLMEVAESSLLYEKIVKELTKREKEVLDLKIKGFSYIEIAKKLNEDQKNISNTLYRIKIKVKKILDNKK